MKRGRYSDFNFVVCPHYIQAAFAFNRAKKVLSHLGLLEGAKVQRGYGSMGKAKEEFYEAIRALPPHVLEHIKNAMVWDSRISKSMRSGQNIFPDRHGRDEFQLISENGSRKKKKRVRILEEVSISSLSYFVFHVSAEI